MLYTDQYNPLEHSLTNAKNVLSLDWLYSGLKQFLGKFLLLALLVLIGFPFVFLFGYWIKTKRKGFQKHMKKTPNSLRDADHYLEFKEHLKNLEELRSPLMKVTRYNIKKAPWPIRYTLSQMQKMSSTLLTYTEWLKTRLDCLNVEQFQGSGKLFTFVSEKEMWRKRNNAYQYWM